ncbi:MAG: hypothetical protein ISR64_07275 [Deltaproteobacteria bacterium]|nr:hypothetical protein [Deltaproteobacteria bacterium]
MPTDSPDGRIPVTDPVRITRILSLTGLTPFIKPGFGVDRVELEGDKVRIHVSWDRVGEGWIMLRSADGSGRFCGTDRISILYQGDSSRLSRTFEALMRRMAESLGETAMEDIVEAVGCPTDRA